MGLGRLYVEHNRNQRDHFGVVLSQALPIGQFARQSVPLTKDYWDLMPKDGDDKEVVEDLILAAIKDAQGKASERAQAEMAKLTEGMGLPADMKLPF